MNAARKAKFISQVDQDVAGSSVYEARWLIGPIFAMALAVVILVALSL